MLRWLFLGLLLAACGDDDPCRGKPTVCIGVHVTGSSTLDRIDVIASLPGGQRLLGQAADLSPPTFVPPVQFALLLPPEQAVGAVGVELIGSFLGMPMAAGNAVVNVPRSGRASLKIHLGPRWPEIWAGASGGAGGGPDMGANVDSAQARSRCSCRRCFRLRPRWWGALPC